MDARSSLSCARFTDQLGWISIAIGIGGSNRVASIQLVF